MSNPAASRTTNGLRLHGIEVTPQGIFEHAPGTQPIFIDRSTIERCAVRSGFVAERPIIGLVVGIGMNILGILLILAAFDDFSPKIPNITGARIGGCATLVTLGSLMLRHSLRRGFYLELVTSAGIRKLTIGESGARVEISSFIDKARREFGYDIRVAIDTMHER